MDKREEIFVLPQADGLPPANPENKPRFNYEKHYKDTAAKIGQTLEEIEQLKRIPDHISQ